MTNYQEQYRKDLEIWQKTDGWSSPKMGYKEYLESQLEQRDIEIKTLNKKLETVTNAIINTTDILIQQKDSEIIELKREINRLQETINGEKS